LPLVAIDDFHFLNKNKEAGRHTKTMKRVYYRRFDFWTLNFFIFLFIECGYLGVASTQVFINFKVA